MLFFEQRFIHKLTKVLHTFPVTTFGQFMEFSQVF